MNRTFGLVSALILASVVQFSSCSSQAKVVTYSNATPSPESGDCGGYTVEFWNVETVPMGRMTAHEGYCEPRGRDIYDVKYDKNDGSLSFRAPDSDEGWLLSFEGVLSAGELKGTVNETDKKTGRAHPHKKPESVVLKRR